MPLLLSLILIFSIFIRSFGISSVPPELFGDELDVGYQAYSLLKTGKDLQGQPLPTYIHSLSEWRLPALIYVTVPTIFMFGLSEFSVRLPQIIFGSLSVLSIFLLVFHLSRSKKAALASAFMLSTLPWHIHYSRVSFEVVFLLNLLIIGSLLYLKDRQKVSLILFSLCIYTYSTATVFVPLLVASLILITKKLPSKISLLISGLVLIPFVFSLFGGLAQERFGLISIFNDTEKIDTANIYRTSEGASEMEKIFHNKPQIYFNLFLNNYLRAFSTQFLFISGDPVFRHGVQVVGHLLPIAALLLVVGALAGYRMKGFSFWLIWLLLSPIPASLTQGGGFHATRLFLMIPPLVYFMSVGIISLSKSKLVVLSVFVVFVFQFASFAHYYFSHYSKESWRWWPVGYKDAVSNAVFYADGKKQIYFNNTFEPSLIRFLFYSKFDPRKFHALFSGDKPSENIVSGYDGFKLGDNLYFGSFSGESKHMNFSEKLKPESIYVISQRDDVGGDWDWRKTAPDGIRVLYTSTNPYGLPVFYVVERKQ